MKTISFLLLVLLLVTSCSGSNPESIEIQNQTTDILPEVLPLDGPAIIDHYCVVCHNEEGCDSPRFLRPGIPPEIVEGNVRAGNGWGMPSFQEVLTEEQIVH